MTLPPDPEEMNDLRAECASFALQAFMNVAGCDLEDAVADLLCDIRHWCDRNGVEFIDEYDRAARHYSSETLSPEKYKEYWADFTKPETP